MSQIVLPGKRLIVGVEDKIDKPYDYDQFDGMPPFTAEFDPSILLGNEETLYLFYVMTMAKEIS
jgi:hypothetical protein